MAENLPLAPPDASPLVVDAQEVLPSGSPRFTPSTTPPFVKEKHIKYWIRCFTTPLPHQYQANDASLLSLTFFTVSALDLLGALESRTTPEDRRACVEAIYACQHPDGGFRGFRGTDLGPRRNESNKVWDPANLAACYFALGSLLVLGDDLSRVDKSGCLKLLCKLQRCPGDGSFGEYLGHDNESIMGGHDTRYGYCAMAVRWILRGGEEAMQGREAHGCADVDVEKLVQCIRQGETFDGGLSEEPCHEAHAGFTYCAVAALSLLRRLPADVRRTGSSREAGLTSPERLVEWLLGRLTTRIDEDEEDDESEDEDDYEEKRKDPGITNIRDAQPSPTVAPSPIRPPPSFQKLRSFPQSHQPSSSSPPPMTIPSAHFDPVSPTTLSENIPAGFSGRSNKLADTCYAFWAGASLSLLSSPECPSEDVLDVVPLQTYLLGKTQHAIAGGFGKFPGDPPDVYHSYMGLAALAMIGIGGEDQTGADNDDSGRAIRRLDPALCISVRAKQWCESLAWRKNLFQNV